MSEAFIVSARKYRPQRFDEVVGQEATTQTLKNAIRNKQLAHSFLFTGSRGIGKTTIARIFAKTINCKELQADGEACNQCDACLSFNRNASFNIIELDAASKNSVDDIRDLIEQVQYAPQNAEYKVFIIDEVHMLSPSAFNAFLKTLEEPPSYAKFILATTEKHKILPTILSRGQIYDFKRISIEDIQKHLKKIADKESIEADDNSLNLIAQKADGGLRDALSMFDRLVSMNGQKLEYTTVVKSLNILDHVVYFQFIEQIVNEKSDGVLLQLNEVLSNGFDLEVFLSGLAEHIRHLWVAKKETTLSLLEFNAEVKSQFVAQSKELDEAYMLNLLQIISECEVQMKTTRNRRLAVELALLKMCYTKKLMQTSWTELGEKKNSDSLVHSSKPRKVENITSKPPSESLGSNFGVKLDDILSKVDSHLKQDPQKNIPELKPITQENIWGLLIDKFEGTLSEKQMLIALKPDIQNETFVLHLQSESLAKMVESTFSVLKKIYTAITGNLAEFRCEVDTSGQIEDMNKRQAFEELAKKYPILNDIHDTFKLDFHT
ncbi:MAG: DNA polymerase III subunit gamma/tau [Chitinophagales bacterium]